MGKPTVPIPKVKIAYKMLSYALALRNPDLRNRKQMAEHVGVTTRTLDRWELDPRFQALKAEVIAHEKAFHKDPSRIDEIYISLWKAATREGRENVMAAQVFLGQKDEDYIKTRKELAIAGRAGVAEARFNIVNVGDSALKTLDIRELQKLKDLVVLPQPKGVTEKNPT